MMFACLLVAYLLQNVWTDLAKLFLLALSWSQDGFRPEKFRISDPFLRNPEKSIFPDFWKNRIPDLEFYGLKQPLDQDKANKKSLAKSVQPFWSY